MRVAVHGHSELMAVYHTAHNKAVGARVPEESHPALYH